jgi:hypothetical protein
MPNNHCYTLWPRRHSTPSYLNTAWIPHRTKSATTGQSSQIWMCPKLIFPQKYLIPKILDWESPSKCLLGIPQLKTGLGIVAEFAHRDPCWLILISSGRVTTAGSSSSRKWSSLTVRSMTGYTSMRTVDLLWANGTSISLDNWYSGWLICRETSWSSGSKPLAWWNWWSPV